MKKMLAFLFLFFACGKLFAFDPKEVWVNWRVFETSGDAVTDFLISTNVITPVYVNKVVISSASISGGTFQFANSTALASDSGASRSTSTIYLIGATGDVIPIEQIYTRALRLIKTGPQRIVIFWEYLYGGKSLGTNGRKD